jgi:hypothetical protein
VTEEKNIIAALQHRRVFQDDPRPFQTSLCLVDDAAHQRLPSSRLRFLQTELGML